MSVWLRAEGLVEKVDLWVPFLETTLLMKLEVMVLIGEIMAF